MKSLIKRALSMTCTGTWKTRREVGRFSILMIRTKRCWRRITNYRWYGRPSWVLLGPPCSHWYFRAHRGSCMKTDVIYLWAQASPRVIIQTFCCYWKETSQKHRKDRSSHSGRYLTGWLLLSQSCQVYHPSIVDLWPKDNCQRSPSS